MGQKKHKAAIAHTNVIATSVTATTVANTADDVAAAGDTAAAVADTADNPAATGDAAFKVVDTTDGAAVTGDAAVKVADTADNAATAGNTAAKVTDTADTVATADVAATADNAVTSAVAVVAIPAVTAANANAAGNANIVNSAQVRKSGTTNIGKVIYPNATTAAGGNTGTTTGENGIDSIHITDFVSVDWPVNVLISVSICMYDSYIICVQLSLLDWQQNYSSLELFYTHLIIKSRSLEVPYRNKYHLRTKQTSTSSTVTNNVSVHMYDSSIVSVQLFLLDWWQELFSTWIILQRSPYKI